MLGRSSLLRGEGGGDGDSLDSASEVETVGAGGAVPVSGFGEPQPLASNEWSAPSIIVRPSSVTASAATPTPTAKVLALLHGPPPLDVPEHSVTVVG